MRFSVITPNYNGSQFLDKTLKSVIRQREGPGIDLQYIVVDGMSTDGSHEILDRYREHIDELVIESDSGPTQAINKGLKLATGDIVSWLNSDDLYYPGTIARVKHALKTNPKASFCFGRCPIINDHGTEIRRPITKFKELFFPFSSRFMFQSINYISQPSVFFRRDIVDAGEPFLREDMVAAWDYEFFLRLWRYGEAMTIEGAPLAAFRWHDVSISGRFFTTQFREELDAAIADAGRWAPQTLLHHCVRWLIVGIYSAMSALRSGKN